MRGSNAGTIFPRRMNVNNIYAVDAGWVERETENQQAFHVLFNAPINAVFSNGVLGLPRGMTVANWRVVAYAAKI
jgi:hypothetical protein